MTMWFLILVSQHCAVNWDKYKTHIEEPAEATEMRCVYSQFKCFEFRGEDFCTNVMESND